LLTETWRARGPVPDETWEFHGARRSGPGRSQMALEIDGQSFKFAEFTVALELDATRERMHGTYYHPAFARIDDEKLRFTATYLTLDGVLGEDEVERWLGVIETSRQPPTQARPIEELVEAVEELRRTADGMKFVVCRGEAEGLPAFATVNLALKRVDHLLACMHGEIDLAILAPNGEGLPEDAELQQLGALEGELVKELGASVVFFGREMRRGRYLLHFFAPEDSGAASIVERWQKRHASRAIETIWKRDPTWDVQRRFG
jgi:hypothetical protein